MNGSMRRARNQRRPKQRMCTFVPFLFNKTPALCWVAPAHVQYCTSPRILALPIARYHRLFHMPFSHYTLQLPPCPPSSIEGGGTQS